MGARKALSSPQIEVPLRIVLRRPPPGVKFALQKGKSNAAGDAELVPPTRTTTDSIAFDFPVRVDISKDDAPRFLGEFAQGPPATRFVYVNSGRRAGQTGTAWDRRAKISLTDIGADLLRSANETPGTVLEIEIEGTGDDGGPVCASVKKSSGWRLVSR
jgi:hypothetical protein